MTIVIASHFLVALRSGAIGAVHAALDCRGAIRLAVTLSLLPATAFAQCRLVPVAVIPLQAVEGFPVVAAEVNGRPVSFVLDSGAQAHLILPSAEAILRLPQMQGTVPVIGTGGEREAPLVRLEGVTLGGVSVMPSPTPVTTLPVVPHVSPLLAGLLGAPLLDQFDLDLNVAGGRLGLFQAGGCGGALPELSARQTVIPLAITRDRQALLDVTINGQSVIALLDTGSRATLLSQPTADALGLRATVSANTSRGVDGESLPVGHAVVREMTVGNDVVRDMPVSISPVQLGRADMLLGLDYLRQRRAFISFVTQRLVIVLPGPAASVR